MTSSFRKLLAAGVLALGAAAGAVRAADATVKVGVLHSLSGTMAGGAARATGAASRQRLPSANHH